MVMVPLVFFSSRPLSSNFRLGRKISSFEYRSAQFLVWLFVNGHILFSPSYTSHEAAAVREELLPLCSTFSGARNQDFLQLVIIVTIDDKYSLDLLPRVNTVERETKATIRQANKRRGSVKSHRSVSVHGFATSRRWRRGVLDE